MTIPRGNSHDIKLPDGRIVTIIFNVVQPQIRQYQPKIRLGFEAPSDVEILRSELLRRGK